MKPDEIRWTDWSRILLGQVPPEYYLELVIRALLVYLLLHLCMRMLGKRMAGQMNVSEMTAMVALASAIGVPMLSYDRGILPAFIIGFIIAGMGRLIARLSFKSQLFEKVSQGDIDMLIEDSRLNLQTMKKVRISQDRLFAQLRSENISHLGAVKRMYMEATGGFMVVQREKKKPGLCVLPDWDESFINELVVTASINVCAVCGTGQPDNRTSGTVQSSCPNCDSNDWTRAVIEKSESSDGRS